MSSILPKILDIFIYNLMIIVENIEIKVNNINVKYYNKLGYKCKGGDKIIIKNSDLSKGSNYKVKVQCDFCGKIKNLPFYKYLKNIEKYNLYSCSNKCAVFKYEKTCLEKYNVKNISHLNVTKEKIKLTKLNRYNNENYNNIEQIRKTCLKRYDSESYFSSNEFKFNYKSQSIDLDEWNQYKKISKRYFKKISKKIFDNWDGYDYYDQSYIKDNLSLPPTHPDYPTIDHIISVYNGFRNNISPEELNSVKNLVITKRKINSKKGYKLLDEKVLNNFSIGYFREKYIKNGTYGTWIIKDIDGNKYIIENLSKYCKNNNLSYTSMKGISYGIVKKHKKWIYVKKVK